MAYFSRFSSQRYLELCNKRLNQTLSKSETFELTDYEVQLTDYCLWQKKSQLIVIIEAFLNYQMDGYEFNYQFFQIFDRKTRENTDRFLPVVSVEELKNVKIEHNYSSSEFGKLMYTIQKGCALFTLDDEDFTESELRSSINEKYKIFMDYDLSIVANTDNLYLLNSNNDFVVLKSIMIFFSLLTSAFYIMLKPELFAFFFNN